VLHQPAATGYGLDMTDNKGFEQDVHPDDAQALSRDEGGVEQPGAPDQNSTTGTTPNEEFVGRVAGDDGGGYEGETGAEARAAARED
jgi:hypothetical protein